jgi:hypothetical protein
MGQAYVFRRSRRSVSDIDSNGCDEERVSLAEQQSDGPMPIVNNSVTLIAF